MLRHRHQANSASSSSRSSSASRSPSPSPSTSTLLMSPEPRSEQQQPLLAHDVSHDEPAPAPAPSPSPSTWLARNQWVGLALASGACAAFNGVFAKLTTTELTTRLSESLAGLVGLDAAENYVEAAVRGTFFVLNLVFNGVMWTLFTRALARGHSATQVSIMNTSANFVITALLGFVIFSEALPPLWWLGATMLVAGNVIIGRKDEGAPANAADAADAAEPAGPELVPMVPTATAAAQHPTPDNELDYARRY